MRWKATPIIIAIYYLLFFVLILLHNAEFTTAFCVSKKISYQLANCDPTKDPFKCDRHKHYPMTNITLRNKPCIPWVQIDQLQDWNFEKNIKTQLSAKFLQSNYCVTTKGHSIPWCYTNTKSLIEEECFHQCPNHWPKDLCLVRQEHGEECTTSLHSCPPETEIVSRNRTIDGKPCLGWRIHPKWSEYPKPNLFHCYPVGDAPGGPWCYYGPGIDDWKYCYKTCPDISCPAIMPQDWKGVSFQRVTIRPPYKSSGDRPRPGTKTTVECSKRAKEEETSITVECLYTGNWSLDLDSLCVSKSDQTLNLFNQLMGNNNVTPLLLFLICLLPVLTLIILTTSLLVRRHRHQNNEDGKMTGNPKMSNADKKISSPRKAPGPKPKPSQQQAPFSTSAKDTTNSEDVATMLAKCRKTKDEGNAVPKPGNHKHGKEKHHDKKKPSNTGTVSLSDHLSGTTPTAFLILVCTLFHVALCVPEPPTHADRIEECNELRNTNCRTIEDDFRYVFNLLADKEQPPTEHEAQQLVSIHDQYTDCCFTGVTTGRNRQGGQVTWRDEVAHVHGRLLHIPCQPYYPFPVPIKKAASGASSDVQPQSLVFACDTPSSFIMTVENVKNRINKEKVKLVGRLCDMIDTKCQEKHPGGQWNQGSSETNGRTLLHAFKRRQRKNRFENCCTKLNASMRKIDPGSSCEVTEHQFAINKDHFHQYYCSLQMQ